MSSRPIVLHRRLLGMWASIAAAVVSGMVALSALFWRSTIVDSTTTGHLWWKKTVVNPDAADERADWSLVLTVALIFTAFFLVLALWLFFSAGRLKKYPPILKGIESMSVERIADITGRRTSVVYRDLRSLIDSGRLNDHYIDYAAGGVVNKSFVPDRSRKTVVECIGCGTRNEIIIGVTKPCRSCGDPLLLRFASGR